MRAVGRRDYFRQSAKLHIFPYPMQNISIRVDTQVAKTPAYTVMCPFSLFVALCDHNPPTLHADGLTSCS